MTYSKGKMAISIELKPIIGKVKPELLIADGGSVEKVATFASVEKAKMFETWLRYFFDPLLVTDETEKYWERRKAEDSEGAQ